MPLIVHFSNFDLVLRQSTFLTWSQIWWHIFDRTDDWLFAFAALLYHIWFTVWMRSPKHCLDFSVSFLLFIIVPLHSLCGPSLMFHISRSNLTCLLHLPPFCWSPEACVSRYRITWCYCAIISCYFLPEVQQAVQIYWLQAEKDEMLKTLSF